MSSDLCERLNQAEAELRLALDAGRIGTWDWNILTGEVRWSTVLETIHGLPAGSFGGTFAAYLAGVHPDDRDLVSHSLANSVERGATHDIEYRIVWPDGTVRWVEGRGQVYRDEQGRRLGMRGVCLDVTERKQAENALRFLGQASTLLSSSLDHEATLASVTRLVVPYLADWCAIDIFDEDGSLHRFGITRSDRSSAGPAREFERRYEPEVDLLRAGSSAVRSGRLELHPKLSATLLAAMARDAEMLETLRRVGLKSAICAPLLAHGQALGAIWLGAAANRRFGPADLGLAEHLARRVAVAVDNARLYREARQAIRQRDEFLAIVTHDLKSPLTMIKGQAQLLARRAARSPVPEPGAMVDGLSRIAAAVTRMTQQINELLDLAHLQMGQGIELDEQPTDLIPLLGRLIEQHQKLAERHHIRLETDLTELVGNWDPSRLERVFDNLLANAVKYSPSGGEITVVVGRETDATGDWATVAVRDHGIGIPAVDLPHVFERFHRARNVAGRIGGSGIGLTSVRQIVERHDGTISATSQEGVGSTFTVRLPYVPEDLSPPPNSDAAGLDSWTE